MSPKISLHIVAWNSMEFIPELLRSIEAQTYENFSVIVVDNASEDGVAEYVREHHPGFMTIRNVRNLGFAGGHNQAMRHILEHTKEEDFENTFVLITNPDVILTPTYLEKIARATQVHPKAASFGGKLLRAFGENMQDEALKETVQSDLIDSTGIHAHKNRTFTERGAGELDKGQYNTPGEVFGISGALALYRASALAQIRHEDEFLDTDFFAYKEDVDLAWRLRVLGWSSRYVPSAVAYHYRGMYGKESAGLMELIKNRRKKSRRRSFYSTRNHWNLLMKNESILNGMLAAPRVIPYEFARVAYVCVFEPGNAKAFFSALSRAPRMWKKRRRLFAECKVDRAEMRSWFE